MVPYSLGRASGTSQKGLRGLAKVTRLVPQLHPGFGILRPNLGLELEVEVEGKFGFSPFPFRLFEDTFLRISGLLTLDTPS